MIRFALACQLQRERALYPLVDGTARFAIGVFEEIFMRQRADFDLHVDAIEQGAGYFTLIARHTIGRAAAFAIAVSQIAARAGIHGGDQLKPGRKIRLSGGA